MTNQPHGSTVKLVAAPLPRVNRVAQSKVAYLHMKDDCTSYIIYPVRLLRLHLTSPPPTWALHIRRGYTSGRTVVIESPPQVPQHKGRTGREVDHMGEYTDYGYLWPDGVERASDNADKLDE